MELNDGMENGMGQRMYTVAANLCNWCCSIKVELPGMSLGLLSHHSSFMSKYGIAYMLLYPSMVLSLAHHQVLCYCSLAKPDSHPKSKSLDL